MRPFLASQHDRSAVRTGLAVTGLLALLGIAGGVGVAFGAAGPSAIQQVKPGIQYVGTYQVTPKVGGGDQRVHWPNVGQVALESICSANVDDGGNPAMGSAPLAFNNNGPGPVGITYVLGSGVYGGAYDPNQGQTSGHFFWVPPNPQPAEPFWINGPGEQWDAAEGDDAAGGIITFGIVNENGPSVTGTLAYSYRFDYLDQVVGTGGHCVFTLQMRG